MIQKPQAYMVENVQSEGEYGEFVRINLLATAQEDDDHTEITVVTDANDAFGLEPGQIVGVTFQFTSSTPAS
jgi:hypothetical protein